jgi:hypothetical protein
MIADYNAIKAQIDSLLRVFYALNTLQREWLATTELLP